MLQTLSSCRKEESVPERNDPPPEGPGDTLNPGIRDDYSDIAEKAYSHLWGQYNLHDPTIIEHEGWYHIFSTDVAYGPNGQCGIMYRRSMDLVQWQFLGWVFDGVPAGPLQFMEQHQPGYRQESIWAPSVFRSGNEFRLYYSVPGNDWVKLACIGLATSSSPEGPWKDEGIVISCQPSDPYNAIDPAVVEDHENGRQWFAYGSYSSGIFMTELDPASGKRINEDDLGHRIAYRHNDHDAIEGAELLYQPELGMYYLFVSYDWLEDNYNVRVGRSEKPEGPYIDILGNDLGQPGDNYPMITARYQFENHAGWQGLGHCGVMRDNDHYFFVSQGRLGSNKYLMNLHVRRLFWSPDGWPMVSPERYANVPDATFTADQLEGTWEHIELAETSRMNLSSRIAFLADGTLGAVENGTWSFNGNLLILSVPDQPSYSCRVFQAWDWENERLTIAYTGMNNEGRCVWGKKRDISK
jgi:arabinan endo-1,5-alpha-L-arabinosidase